MVLLRTAIDESALLARLRSGSEEAFAELVREHGPAMLAAARRILRNEEDARDALQDACLSAFRAIAGFGGDARLSTWLHRIAVNAALMRARSIGRRREQPSEVEIEDLLPRFTRGGHHAEPPRAWAEPADAGAERDELRALVRRAIERLPPDYRLALILRDIEGLETEAIAEHLGITANATKIRVHRARQALRTILDPTLSVQAP
jgi:RNA polymerase sigma-70 factor (ECF subfamily)